MRTPYEVIEDILRNQHDVRTALSNYNIAIIGAGALSVATLGGLAVTYEGIVLTKDALIGTIEHLHNSEAALYSIKATIFGLATTLSACGTAKTAIATIENLESIPELRRQFIERLDETQTLAREYDTVMGIRRSTA